MVSANIVSCISKKLNVNLLFNRQFFSNLLVKTGKLTCRKTVDHNYTKMCVWWYCTINF